MPGKNAGNTRAFGGHTGKICISRTPVCSKGQTFINEHRFVSILSTIGETRKFLVFGFMTFWGVGREIVMVSNIFDS